MPTETKDQVDQTGFFERIGRKADQAVSWIGKNINHARATYSSINSDYVKVIRSHKLSKILPPSLILLTLCLVLLLLFMMQIIDSEKILYDNQTNASVVATEPILDGEIMQTIINEDNVAVSSISILIGTHERINRADYEFTFKKNDEVVYSDFFSATSLSDNSYYQFKIPITQLGTGSEYSFSIRALNTNEDNAISLYRDSKTNEVIYRLNYRSPYRVYIVVISIIFLIVFCLINLLINSGKIKSDFHFLACTLVYIVSLIFIYPACTIPDEQYHFLGTVRLAEYNFSETPSQNFSRSEIALPANSECLMTQYLYNSGRFNEEDFIECFTPTPEENKQYIKADNTNRALAYLPAAIGFKLGDFISDSPMVIFYFGRVFNLIAISIVIIYALILVKKHRIVLLAIIFIPMFLQQAVSYSYDGLLNAFCLLIIAYSIRFLTMDVKLRVRDIAIMAVALAVIGLIKLPYVIIATPLLFVKTEKFGRHKWAKWLILSSLLVASVSLYAIDSQIKLPEIESATTSGRGLPLSSLLDSPLNSIRLVLHTLHILGSFYITSMIGYFGWFYFALNPIIVISYFIFLLTVVLSSHEAKISRTIRYVMVLISFAIIGSVFLAMYLSHTTPGSPVIEGVQGRYFLPVLPLLMFAFMPKKEHIHLSSTACYAFFNLIMFCFTVTLLIGFY